MINFLQATVVVLVLAVTFSLLETPTVLFSYSKHNSKWHDITNQLLIANACVNFFIFLVTKEDFRTGLCQLATHWQVIALIRGCQHPQQHHAQQHQLRRRCTLNTNNNSRKHMPCHTACDVTAETADLFYSMSASNGDCRTTVM